VKLSRHGPPQWAVVRRSTVAVAVLADVYFTVNRSDGPATGSVISVTQQRVGGSGRDADACGVIPPPFLTAAAVSQSWRGWDERDGERKHDHHCAAD
jgi:hypothetical protein